MIKKEAVSMIQDDIFCRVEVIENKAFNIHDICGDFYAFFGFYYNKTVISGTGSITHDLHDKPVGDLI
jgi:hypothetical protein